MFLSYLRIHPSIKQHAQIFEPVFLWKHHTILRERILQRRDRHTIEMNHLRLGRVHSIVNPFFSAYLRSLFSIVCISSGSLVVNPRSSAYEWLQIRLDYKGPTPTTLGWWVWCWYLPAHWKQTETKKKKWIWRYSDSELICARQNLVRRDKDCMLATALSWSLPLSATQPLSAAQCRSACRSGFRTVHCPEA